MLLMIAMFLMTVVSGKSGFRHQDHPGPKRGSEHQRGNRLDRAHCNLLFVWLRYKTSMLRATSAASSRLILASSLACGTVDRYAPFNEPGLNRSRPPIGGHSAHLIQIRACISTAPFDTWRECLCCCPRSACSSLLSFGGRAVRLSIGSPTDTTTSPATARTCSAGVPACP